MTKKNYHCGPYWMPQWLKRILSWKYNEACKLHDHGYREQPLPREVHDELFLLDLIRSSSTLLGYFIAVLFFYAVRKLGQKSWDRNTQLYHRD